MINDYIRKTDTTEDGDIEFTRTIECDTFAEAREVTADLKQLLTRGGSTLYHNVVWTAKGGKLVWKDTYVVDGAEVALEAANDAWASNIAAMEPEWAR
jgi:hypothetical protein